MISIIIFHIFIFYFIGTVFSLGYIDLNNKFEDRRPKSFRFGGSYKEYYIKRRQSLKSFYFLFEVFILKKY